MNQILMCTGERASKPYYFEKAYVNLYSIEELCYILYENAFMLDKDILKKDLVEWIDKECKLHDLARELYTLINQNALPSSFAGSILDYTGYYSKDEIERVESILRMNATMSVFEKWKAKADFLFENRHFLLAVKEYERVLENVSEDELALKEKIYNNLGVTYMELYMYDLAIENFKKAYEIDNNPLAYKHYLTALRLKLSEEDYIKYIADDEEAYRQGIPIESELESVKREFETSEDAERLRALFLLKDEPEASLYYSEITGMTENLKGDYRDIALEAEQK